MRILVVGGNGSVGRGLVPALLACGHDLTVLDLEIGALAEGPHLRLVKGALEDADAVGEASRGAEAIVHLAWSFSDDPVHLLEHDLRGHLRLLEAARAQRVRRFIYASSAVVYGKPLRVPIDESHPLEVLQARKPAYGMAKAFAEQLTRLAGQVSGLPATVLRLWWLFGEEISGRHLRDMLKTAAAGEPLPVPADCGGSFLTQSDFNRAVELCLLDPEAAPQVFNLASGYVTWEEMAGLVVAVAKGTGGVQVVPRGEWTGAAFLADRWELDDSRFRQRYGWAPALHPSELRQSLRAALDHTWRAVANA